MGVQGRGLLRSPRAAGVHSHDRSSTGRQAINESEDLDRTAATVSRWFSDDRFSRRACHAVMDRVEQEWDLFEPEEDLQARIANYDKAQKQVWAELVECCKGTPSVMMRNVPKACGTVAWRLLEKSYGKVSTTTTVALLDRLLDYKPSTKQD